MRRLRGQTVALTVKTQSGTDSLGCPEYTETTVDVENVIVDPVSAQDLLDTLNLTGRRAVYTLHIPKGDANVWEDTTVRFWGRTWRTIGMPIAYMEELTPGEWNQKVQVERYGS